MNLRIRIAVACSLIGACSPAIPTPFGYTDESHHHSSPPSSPSSVRPTPSTANEADSWGQEAPKKITNSSKPPSSGVNQQTPPTERASEFEGEAGYIGDYDSWGNEVGQKPYWGSGNRADPYRDYADVNKPFGDRIWGSGTKNDPYTNIGSPPHSNQDNQHAPDPQNATESVINSGKERAEQSTPDRKTPQTPPVPKDKNKERLASKVQNNADKLESIEKEFAEKVRQQEEAIDSYFTKTRDEFQVTLNSYNEGSRIIWDKLHKVGEQLTLAKVRGDQSEVARLERDEGTLLLEYAQIETAKNSLQQWLAEEQQMRAESKQALADVHHNFKIFNEQLKNENKTNPWGVDYTLNDHLEKWNPKKLTDWTFEPNRDQSPLVRPRVFNPATDKTRVAKQKWHDQRKAQIEKEYELKIDTISNEPSGTGAQAAGSALSKNERIQQLVQEKESKLRQVRVLFRQSLINSGRLTQDEYNALNTPEWQETLNKYHDDIKQGRIGGDTQITP